MSSQLTTAHSLPYPHRYEVADKYWSSLPGAALSQESQLVLYALKQQVSQGPCTKPAGWGWSVVESAKHQAWKQLGNMSSMEAMRLFVRTLDEERPDWYAALQAADQAPTAGAVGGPAPVSAAVTPAHANGSSAAHGAPESHSSGGGPATDTLAGTAGGGPDKGAAVFVPAPVASFASEGAWAAVPTATAAGKKGPCPRYEHGAAVMGNALFVVGGNYAGRYLADVWRLDLSSSVWTPLLASSLASVPSLGSANGTPVPAQQQQAEVPGGEGQGGAVAGLVPLAGHSVTVWGDQLLLLGGHVKAKTADAAGTLPVRALSPSSASVALLEPQGTGKPPRARGGHSATLVGQELWVFGGEDATRRPLDDLHCLDLGSMVWLQPLVRDEAPPKRGEPAAPWPSARSAHAAASYLNRFVLVFGGGSAATCYSDVHVLDTLARAWLPIKTTGHPVTPRAGHSAVVFGDVLYVVGGGNNVRGCTDMLGLDLMPLRALAAPPPASSVAPPAPTLVAPLHLTWHSLGSTPARDPLSSEGVSLLLLPPRGRPVLAAFGGYNGKYQGTLSVTLAPPLPSATTTSTANSPAAAAAASASTSATPKAAVPTQQAQPDSAPNKQQQQPAATPTAAAAVPARTPKSNGNAQPAPGEVEALRQEVARLQAALDVAREEAETAVRAAAAVAAAESHELALLRKQLGTSQSALETASKGLEDARAALGRESAKVLRLEAEVAELNKRLTVEAEARKELEQLRRQIKEAEAKKGSGIWGFVTGS